MGQGSGVAVSCGISHWCGLDPELLWLWCSHSSDSTPTLGASICFGYGPKKKKKNENVILMGWVAKLESLSEVLEWGIKEQVLTIENVRDILVKMFEPPFTHARIRSLILNTIFKNIYYKYNNNKKSSNENKNNKHEIILNRCFRCLLEWCGKLH